MFFNPDAASSDKTAEWVESLWKKNPCTLLPNGNIRTGPVRLSYPFILERGKPQPPRTEGSFGTAFLFPAGADISALKTAAVDIARSKWPNAGKPGGPSLHSPFRDQGEKDGKAGYVPGSIFMSAYADKQAPYCVDKNSVPVVEKSRIYPGVWALVVLRPFVFDKGVKKGPSFGLQGVVLIADDENIGGGGGGDVVGDTSGINLGEEISSSVDPTSLFA